MKKEILLKNLKQIETDGGFGLQAFFESDYEGNCPCFSGKFEVDDKECEVWGKCWRVSENAQDLHILAPSDVAKAIKRCLDKQKWYNKYTLIKHSKPFLNISNELSYQDKNA